MPTSRTLPEQLVLRLDERSLRGFAKLRRGDGELRVFVPYTSPDLTRTALAEAAVLTRSLSPHITLFLVHVVPFPLPLDKPDVSAAFLERRLAAVVRDAGVEADIRIGFARDRDFGSEQILPPNSLVVMATRRRWWPTAEAKLARALARAGHSVALLGV
jgi:hypothetical protein